jgi:hypothetical protein
MTVRVRSPDCRPIEDRKFISEDAMHCLQRMGEEAL